jgi:hypothetical protein
MEAETRTCRLSGHPEFALDYDPAVVIEPDIRWLLEFLERSVASGTKYRAGESVRVGWADLLIEQGDRGRLWLQEPDWTGVL